MLKNNNNNNKTIEGYTQKHAVCGVGLHKE